MKLPNTHNIGDLVMVYGEQSWFRIVYINVYIEKDVDTGEICADVYYGVENVWNALDIIEIHEDEVVYVLKSNEVTGIPLPMTPPQELPKFSISGVNNPSSITVPEKEPTVDDLLNQLIAVKELNTITNNAFADEEAEIIEKLRKLTSKEGD